MARSAAPAAILTPGRRYARFPVIVAIVLSVITVVILLVPYLSFSWYAPRVRLPLETASVMIAAATAGMAYLRYSLEGRRSWLLISTAFLAIALSRLAFGIFVDPSGMNVQEGAYLWIGARLVAAVVLLVAAFAPERWDPVGSRTAPTFARTGGIVLLALVAVQGLAWLLRGQLPPLVDRAAVVAPQSFNGFQPGLTLADVVFGVLGTALYLVAAWGFAAERGPDAEPRAWLAAALVLAAFAHIHYMLVPTVFTDHISTGDILRFAMSGVLLVALTIDVRRTYLAQRTRAIELERAYLAERARVTQLEELERAKVDLLRMLSHELLHPVAAIRALALGLSRRRESLDDVQWQAVEGLVNQSAQLRDLVERAPDITELRLGSLALNRARWTVPDVLQHVDRTFVHLVARLTVEPTARPTAAAMDIDISRIMQVFHNLLSNAEKFSPPGSPIRVRSRVEASAARFEVQDVGPGIDTDRLGPRFEPATDRPFEAGAQGLGVGLYVSRLIVEAHGGHLWSEPPPGGHGALLAFTIPLAEGGGS